MDVIRVFLGFDGAHPIAFHVAAHSIHRHSSGPVSITPLILSQLGGIFRRARDPRQSTDFAFTRFLVPYLCDYQGWALYLDSDVLVREDVAHLWDLRDDRCAVQVVQHRHLPLEGRKVLGHEQTRYPRKNWSSLMLFNNARCHALTREYVETAPGLALHGFKWLGNDDLVGALPPRWNHLVDYDVPVPVEELAVLHYTSGGPWIADYRRCGFASAWWHELRRALATVSDQGWPHLPVPRDE